jgi:hypothetical protein
MKLFSRIAIIVFIATLFSSCHKQESYSIIPAITYKNFIINSDSTADIQINFTDGDGDIGYPTSDANPPYDFYFVPLHDSIATSGITYYVPLWLPSPNIPALGDTLGSGYNIPYITPSGKDKALSGQIQIHLNKFDWKIPLPGTKSAEYWVWIIDRANHISNRITTPIIKFK